MNLNRFKPLCTAVLIAVCLAACGPVKVTYSLACVATCPSTGATSNIALTACDLDGQDPNAIAAANVSSCLTAAKNGGCSDPTCACQVTRTTTVCE